MRVCWAGAAAVIGWLGVFQAGCATCSAPADGGGDMQDDILAQAGALVQGDWTLDALEGAPGSELAPNLPRGLPTLSIASDGRVSGMAGLNRYTSSLDPVALSEGGFAIGPAAATKMAGPPEAMRIEDQFLTALARVASFDAQQLAQGALALLDAHGTEVLRFIRAQP